MYIGDSRTSYTYDYQDFYMTVGHEFGHVFGIGDMYNDESVKNKIPSIMNSQFWVSGAQSYDYAMLLEAQARNAWLSWGKNRKIWEPYVN